jgi:serine phosphatase RsbU (regulator of sigma subunit)/ligand-binding sensor domain-containing protein
MIVRVSIFLLFFLLTLQMGGLAQKSIGLIPIQTFGTEDYKTQPSNWCFAEDQRGAIYVGNKEALLVYTGAWKKYVLSNHEDVKSIDISADGKIYVGGKGEFGFFMVDSNNRGTINYEPLFMQLDSSAQQKVGEIWYTFVQDKAVYFGSREVFYFYKNKKVSVIELPGEVVFVSEVHNRLFVGIKKIGLFELKDGKLLKYGRGEFFLVQDQGESKLNIKVMVGYGQTKVLFIDIANQLYSYDLKTPTQRPKAFHTQLDSLFAHHPISKIINLRDQLFGVYSSGNGVYIIDNQGKFIRKLDKKSGIKEDLVESMFIDRHNHLWLAHNTGISKVAIFNKYQVFPPELTGFKGRIQKIERFNGKLFIASSFQLYYVEEPQFTENVQFTFEEIQQLNFTKCKPFDKKESLANGCYYLLKVKIEEQERLLFITNDFVFSVDEKERIDTAFHQSGNVLIQDPIDSHRIWIGLYPKGLSSFYFQDGKWIEEASVPNTNYEIVSFAFDHNYDLWMGRTDAVSVLRKPVFINHQLVKPMVVDYGVSNGLPLNDAVFTFFDSRQMIFGTSEGLFLFNPKEDRFSTSNLFTDWFKSHHVHRMLSDSKKNIWAVTYNTDHSKIMLKRLQQDSKGSYHQITPYAIDKNSQAFDALFQDGASIWAGGTFDLVKINNFNDNDSSNFVKAYINNILANNRDTLFDGYFVDSQGNIVDNQDASLKPILRYRDNNFTFQFSAISQKLEGKPLFRWMLDGYDQEWGNWTTNMEVQFTNLPEGNYTFRLQAMDTYGNISEEISYGFTIKPPWYRTIVAFIGYFLLFVAFVMGAINVSTRSLKKIIKDATAEIVAQKEDIEEKSQSILSSIRYAQRIQEAVTPQKMQMDSAFPEHFVLWKPRDIVSGDFYWMMQKGEKVILAAADCTGHGVPGAFMSIMGISFLNEIANNKDVNTAAEALNHLRHNVITSLNREGSVTDTKDGMDISLCVFDFKNMMMQFAGAYNPLYMIRQGELAVIKADRMPIGIHERDSSPFTNMEFSIHKGDVFYILSDGYIDQFGGQEGKKFMTKQFKDLIQKIHDKPMLEQKEILWQTILEWRGEIEQVDDIIIIGVRVV